MDRRRQPFLRSTKEDLHRVRKLFVKILIRHGSKGFRASAENQAMGDSHECRRCEGCLLQAQQPPNRERQKPDPGRGNQIEPSMQTVLIDKESVRFLNARPARVCDAVVHFT